jgi:hypothetical protein
MLKKTYLYAVVFAVMLSGNAFGMNFQFFDNVSNVCGYKDSKVAKGNLRDWVCTGAARAIDLDTGDTFLCRYFEEIYVLNGTLYKETSRQAMCGSYFKNNTGFKSDTIAYQMDTYASVTGYTEEADSRKYPLLWSASKDRSKIGVCYLPSFATYLPDDPFPSILCISAAYNADIDGDFNFSPRGIDLK